MPIGGKRIGAGRPKDTGKYKCPTKVIRIPAHLEKEIKQFIKEKSCHQNT